MERSGRAAVIYKYASAYVMFKFEGKSNSRSDKWSKKVLEWHGNIN